MKSVLKFARRGNLIMILVSRDVKKANEVLFELDKKQEKFKKLCTETPEARILVKTINLSKLELEKIKRVIAKYSELPDDMIKFGEYRAIQEKETDDKLGLHTIKETYEVEVTNSDTRFFRTNLRSGQKLEYGGSIVIIGDLNNGAEAIAGGNIVVTGTIRGLAHAGANGNKKAIIAGHSIENTQVRIANVVKEIKETDGKLPVIYIENDEIEIDFLRVKSAQPEGKE